MGSDKSWQLCISLPCVYQQCITLPAADPRLQETVAYPDAAVEHCRAPRDRPALLESILHAHSGLHDAYFQEASQSPDACMLQGGEICHCCLRACVQLALKQLLAVVRADPREVLQCELVYLSGTMLVLRSGAVVSLHALQRWSWADQSLVI